VPIEAEHWIHLRTTNPIESTSGIEGKQWPRQPCRCRRGHCDGI
jgi:hypothetical protein